MLRGVLEFCALIVYDDFEQLVVEEIVEHTISRAQNDVSTFELELVVVRMLGLVLANVVLVFLQHLPKFDTFADLACQAELLAVFFGRQNRQLVRYVERVDLLSRSEVQERLNIGVSCTPVQLEP